MNSRLAWSLRTAGVVVAAAGAVAGGVLLGQYGKALFNAAML